MRGSGSTAQPPAGGTSRMHSCSRRADDVGCPDVSNRCQDSRPATSWQSWHCTCAGHAVAVAVLVDEMPVALSDGATTQSLAAVGQRANPLYP